MVIVLDVKVMAQMHVYIAPTMQVEITTITASVIMDGVDHHARYTHSQLPYTILALAIVIPDALAVVPAQPIWIVQDAVNMHIWMYMEHVSVTVCGVASLVTCITPV
jgi:hypothetical protein